MLSLRPINARLTLTTYAASSKTVAARGWMRQDIGGKEASEIAADGSVSADHFIWHRVSREVGNVRNQSSELINSISI